MANMADANRDRPEAEVVVVEEEASAPADASIARQDSSETSRSNDLIICKANHMFIPMPRPRLRSLDFAAAWAGSCSIF